ncbi:hypothetical protein MBLNU457_5628t1 [Dothideomycetes sp. NU457]
MSSAMEFLPKPLTPITSSRPPHLDLFENGEVVVKLPAVRWPYIVAVSPKWLSTTGREDVKDQSGPKRTYNRKYRRDRDKAWAKSKTAARRNNKRPSRQPAPSLPPSPPDSQQYIPTGWNKSDERPRFTKGYTGWESGWSNSEWGADPTSSNKAQQPVGWSSGNGWSNVNEADKASGWDTPAPNHDQPSGWTTDDIDKPDTSWGNQDPFPEASVPTFWTGLSRVWLTDYAVHELSCQIAIERGDATARAPFKRPWVRVPEGAEDAWVYEKEAMAGLTDYIPVDWNKEQAVLDRGGYSCFLNQDKAGNLAGRDRLEELTEPELGHSSYGLEWVDEPVEERRWWEIADSRSPRLQVSWQNIEGCRREARSQIDRSVVVVVESVLHTPILYS